MWVKYFYNLSSISIDNMFFKISTEIPNGLERAHRNPADRTRLIGGLELGQHKLGVAHVADVMLSHIAPRFCCH